MRKRVFSGVQPSGILTLGNYLGAIKRFVEIQDEFEAFYCVVDYHAITVPQPPESLRSQIARTAAFMLGAGLDPEKMTLFVQSDVPAHTQLGWIMECTATFGELSRMTQFKDKSQGKESVSGGLFTYPALMAADILLYDADAVPVGEDQKQHVELCRDLAERFNSRFGSVLKVPEPLIAETGARIMSLQDPHKKMSKSDPNPSGYISLADSKDDIAKKIRRAVTDSGREVAYDPEEKPALANLITIFSHCSGRSIDEVVAAYEGKGYAEFKKDLAEVVVEALTPVQARHDAIVADGSYVEVLREGARRAHEVSSTVLRRVKEAMGLSLFIDPEGVRI
ncbi:MAG: tryptophan--tRNA ligase [Firmicutes bacterium]|jgi:tryptophanyl-tRNA synthetase|nr:tryptophan--tRNA ligase [Candidatus Fermentithermobacillaceae bacterium]